MNRRKALSIMTTAAFTGLVSCQDYFLKKPETAGTVDLDEVYSSKKNAEAALFHVYRDALIQGWPGGIGIYHGALGSLCGERARGWSWHETYSMAVSGPRTTGNLIADDFPQNWSSIRAAFLVKENIDKVPDLSAEVKQYIKAECSALIAYRYMGMFYRYGGVPIVKKSFIPTDKMDFPRASLKETFEYTLQLCDEAIEGLPNSWPSNSQGRFTKGAAMAIKARTLMFAARPLFNSSTPYLDFGKNNDMICFGNTDQNRWQDAIKANEAVVNWANSNGYNLINTGGAGLGNPNPNALDDYGTATSVPNNKEVLLAYKLDEPSLISNFYDASESQPTAGWETELVGLMSNFMELYYAKDGSQPFWPQIGDPAPFTANDWGRLIENMESRFRLDYVVQGYGTLNNVGVGLWTIGGGWVKWVGNYQTENNFPTAGGGSGHAAGAPAKFYYKAGSRPWFEPPLFRMAEIHLNLAEAYNETGNTVKALYNLNLVHNRAGLPALTEANQSKLRELIWREKAIEMVGENHRYYDVKHWKHPDIDNGIIGGQFRELQFQTTANNRNQKDSLKLFWQSNTYVGYWNPKMHLEPFPQSEVNKGFIVQNPGF